MIWDLAKRTNKVSTILCAIKILSKEFICGMISITLIANSAPSLPVFFHRRNKNSNWWIVKHSDCLMNFDFSLAQTHTSLNKALSLALYLIISSIHTFYALQNITFSWNFSLWNETECYYMSAVDCSIECSPITSVMRCFSPKFNRVLKRNYFLFVINHGEMQCVQCWLHTMHFSSQKIRCI